MAVRNTGRRGGGMGRSVGTAKLKRVNTRLFAEDVSAIKKIAAQRGLHWQIELRMLVRRALKGEQREVLLLRDQP